MKASQTHLAKLLDGARQFVIPIYQRSYSWTETQCAQLFDDVARVAGDESLPAHFIGSVVYVERGIYQATAVPELLVIDGQQRLTTFSLLVEALARALERQGVAEGSATPRRLRNRFLLNADEDGDRRFKLVLSQGDEATFKALVRQVDLPAGASRRVVENFEYFESRVESSGVSVEDLYAGLRKLVVVEVALDRNHDNPQLIFESLNSTGLDLSQADLVRNFVLMGLEPDKQRELYEDHWRPMEELLTTGDREDEFDWFLRAWLTVRTHEVHKREKGYEIFKRYRREQADQSMEDLAGELHRFAGHYACIVLGEEPEDRLDEVWKRLQGLRVDAPLPFLMTVRDDLDDGRLELDDAVAIAELIETWLFRRMVCDIPSNVLSRTFATLNRNLDEDELLESLSAWLLCRTGRQRFPSDEEFQHAFTTRNFYDFRGRQYCLTRLENQGRKELVEMGQYTVEHVLPQNENLSKDWRDMLGPDWRQIQERQLHTIGNLTLTGYNPELSDRSFTTKREMEGGFADSPLRVNRSIAKCDVWNESTIEERGGELAEQGVGIWGAPVVEPEVLAVFRERTRAKKNRGPRSDVEHLEMSPEVRGLYELMVSGAAALGLEPTIWSAYVCLDPPDLDPTYSTCRLQARRQWLTVRFCVAKSRLEGVPAIATSTRDHAGQVLTWIRAKTEADIRACLDLLRQVLERGLSPGDQDDGDGEDSGETDLVDGGGETGSFTRSPLANPDHFRMAPQSRALYDALVQLCAGRGLVPVFWKSWVGFAMPGAGKPYPIILHPSKLWLRAAIRSGGMPLVLPQGLELIRGNENTRYLFYVRDAGGVEAFSLLLSQIRVPETGASSLGSGLS